MTQSSDKDLKKEKEEGLRKGRGADDRVCQDDLFALALTLGHVFLAEYKVTGSRL